MKIVPSKLLEAGTRFMVQEEGSTCKNWTPNSIGFVSVIVGLDNAFQNVAKFDAIMTRVGKGGKARLQKQRLTCPILMPEFSKEEHAKAFAKLMPEGDKKYHVNLERDMPICTHLNDIDSLDFLGFAAALTHRLTYMTGKCRHSRWPEKKSNPLRIMTRLYNEGVFDEDPDYHLDRANDLSFRESFVEEMRKMAGSLAKIQLQLDSSKVSAEIHAAKFLQFVNSGEFLEGQDEKKENEYHFTDDSKLLKDTITYYESVQEQVKKVIAARKGK